MTQDEIIEMARQAGLETQDGFSESVFYFAKLAADKRVEGMVVMTPDEFKSVWDKAQAEEREACLEIIDNFVDFPYLEPTMKAIKARGKA